MAANPFEFDSRFLRSATSLAADGHHLRILGWSAPGLPPEEELAPGVRLTRLDIDRRISNALKPLPERVRRRVCRLVRLDYDAPVLPPDVPAGFDRLLHLFRRTLEIVANARRVGPWADAVVAAAPETEVFHAQSLIVLPVVRESAKRLGGRFVYDVADYHTEAARLARMPWIVREVVHRRERDWARDGSAFLAVSDPVADLVVRKWGVPRPTVLWNCPPAWHPEQPGIVESDKIREATGIEPERPVVLYQGGFSVDRGVEELVAAATEPRLMELGAAVVFMGYGRLESLHRRRGGGTSGPGLPAAGRAAGRPHALDRERRCLVRGPAAENPQPEDEPAQQALRIHHGRRAGRGQRGQRAVPLDLRRADRRVRRYR